MMGNQESGHKGSCWRRLFLVVIALGLTALPAAAPALSPRDLILVYNLNLPESLAVASYYAEKRGVPAENLFGVNAPTTESISREDYELVLAEPLRRRLREFQAHGGQPALLLIYGIPLRVDDPLFSRWFNLDQEFLKLAQGKVRELAAVCWRLQGQLNGMMGGKPLAEQEPPPVAVLEQGRRLVAQAVNFLQQRPAKAGEDRQRRAMLSEIIKLAGSAPEFDLYRRQTQSRRGGGGALPPQLQQFALLRTGQEEARFRGIVPETALELAPSVRHTDGLLGELEFWLQAVGIYENPLTAAAVDSELSLLLAEPYQKARWLPNPFRPAYDRLPFIANLRQATIMVGRLDGPSPEIARRLVDDALAVEAEGLQGTFYIDARGLQGDPKTNGYVQFDNQLRQLADYIRQQTTMPVVLNNEPGLFPAGAGLSAALYVGWYSLGKYVDAFIWQRGAVAYHVASAECVTLHRTQAEVWCKRLLEKGVAATLGPVAEPYLQSFPPPEEFFPLLLSGTLPLLEVYYRTIPHLSWRQVCVGDPLYTPFRQRSPRREHQAKP